MALTPITGRPPRPTSTTPAPVDPRASAQRAFFQAALNKTQAPTVVAKAPMASSDSRALQPAVTRLKDETAIPPHPGRVLRPGSLIDIKV